MTIRKEQKSLAVSVRLAKLFTGLKLPNAGPIFPSEDAAAPKAVVKSKPRKVRITELIIKMST